MFRELMTLQDRMNRLFDQSLPQSHTAEGSLFTGSWTPTVDIYETEQAIVLKADLPEIDPNDVDIRVEDNMLFLRGERKMDKETKEENYHRVERSYGSFARSFALPHTISPEQITAEYKSGVLRITLPKKEETRPKQIKVSVHQ